MNEHENADVPLPPAPEHSPEATLPSTQTKSAIKGAVHKRPGKKVVIAAVALFVLISGAGGFALWRSKHKTVADLPLTRITVRLQWLHGAEFAGMYVAQDKGYYKAEGLDVNLKEYEDGVDINKEVTGGQADYGVNTPLEIVLARNSGENIKAIAAIYQVNPYAIAVRKESKINTPSDFRGKVLGGLGNNNQAQVTYAALLANAGLSETDATIKGVDFDAVKVLRDHDADTADIYRTDQTFLLDQAHIAYNLIYPEDFGVSSYGDVVIASDKKISEQPDQVQAFVNATLKGWEYAVDHQDETLRTLTRIENEAYKVAGYEKFVLEATAPLVRPTGNQSYGSMDYSIWNRIYLTVETAGLIDAPMEVQSLYTGQFIK